MECATNRVSVNDSRSALSSALLLSLIMSATLLEYSLSMA